MSHYQGAANLKGRSPRPSFSGVLGLSPYAIIRYFE